MSAAPAPACGRRSHYRGRHSPPIPACGHCDSLKRAPGRAPTLGRHLVGRHARPQQRGAAKPRPRSWPSWLAGALTWPCPHLWSLAFAPHRPPTAVPRPCWWLPRAAR